MRRWVLWWKQSKTIAMKVYVHTGLLKVVVVVVVVVMRGLIWLVDDGFWAGLITTLTCTTGVVKSC